MWCAREPTRRLRAAVSSDDAADDEDDEYIDMPPLEEPKRSRGKKPTAVTPPPVGSVRQGCDQKRACGC